ncbi:hypothetical protein, partial [Marinoscillum sp. MHG1-6]|uniref:hypothetical protein n=1 Tax=Marinoscillum sp. MHG1-6 TaxID=2959627 RepID=UPI0021584F76
IEAQVDEDSTALGAEIAAIIAKDNVDSLYFENRIETEADEDSTFLHTLVLDSANALRTDISAIQSKDNTDSIYFETRIEAQVDEDSTALGAEIAAIIAKDNVDSLYFENRIETEADEDSLVFKENIDSLVTLSGQPANTGDFGTTFTGSTIPDNASITSALQSLETAVESTATLSQVLGSGNDAGGANMTNLNDVSADSLGGRLIEASSLVSSGDSLHVAGNADIDGAVNIDDSLSIANNANVGGTLSVGGAVTITTNTEVASSASSNLITVGSRSVINIQDTDTGLSTPITLSNGVADGQMLILILISSNNSVTGMAVSLADSGNLKIAGNWTPLDTELGSTISLMWSSALSSWVELNRSLN